MSIRRRPSLTFNLFDFFDLFDFFKLFRPFRLFQTFQPFQVLLNRDEFGRLSVLLSDYESSDISVDLFAAGLLNLIADAEKVKATNSVWPVKICQMSIKVAQKMISLENWKILIPLQKLPKMWAFRQNNCGRSLRKVAQSAKNHPI